MQRVHVCAVGNPELAVSLVDADVVLSMRVSAKQLHFPSAPDAAVRYPLRAQ